jgi:hypothetical protein
VHAVEEVALKDGIVSFQIIFLNLILNISEVRIAFEVKCFGGWQALEGLIAFYLVCRRQLHRALWNDMAVILNGKHVIVHPINLFQVDFNNFFLLFDSRCELIFLASLPIRRFLRNDCWINWYLDTLVYKHWLSLEQLARHLIIVLPMLIVDSGERLEDHAVGRTAPVEPFLRKLVPVFVDYAHGDVVICFDTANSAPE